MSKEQSSLGKYIENTLLKPDALLQDIKDFVFASLDYNFAGLCVPPFYVPMVNKWLNAVQETQIVTVIGFPLGYNSSDTKLYESKKAIADGADELDLVMNISAFKSGEYQKLKAEISEIAHICHSEGKLLKLIIEVAYLKENEIQIACEIGVEAGIDLIKTSTGFAPQKREITEELIKEIRSCLPTSIGIKASGGIKSATHAKTLIDAGAYRIGTSSGISILQETSRS